MARTIAGSPRLRGEIKVPPDKSISHRAAILGALAEGPSSFENFLAGADCLSTISCLRALGVSTSLDDAGVLRVDGKGVDRLIEPDDVLDCGNSGTTMRLLSGVLAGRPFRSVLTGDESLRERPMRRIADPLSQMGASVETTSAGTAPLTISGGDYSIFVTGTIPQVLAGALVLVIGLPLIAWRLGMRRRGGA